MVKSIANRLSYSSATFSKNTLTSYQLYPVPILEMTCNLKVTATVADGTSTNRKFFRMHKVIYIHIYIDISFFFEICLILHDSIPYNYNR